MSQPASAHDSARDHEIKRVRRIATGILLFLVTVFAATFLVPEPPLGVQLVRAMAEAGMVGGIADWFAVEALFRRPLGLPIPHTALLPNNQKRAATNIARFVDENFLAPDRLLPHLRQVDPVKRLTDWLSQRANADMIGRELSGFLHLILKRQLKNRMDEKSSRFLSKSLLASLETGQLADQIAAVLKQSVHGPLLDDILARVHDVLDKNRNKVSELVRERSRWWISSRVDERIVTLLVDGMLSVVDELSEENSAIRREFETSISKIIEDFRSEGALASYLEDGLNSFGASPDFEHMLSQMVRSVLRGIESDMASDPDRFASSLGGAIQDFARHVAATPEVSETLNQRLFHVSEVLLAELRPAATTYVAQTIANWDSRELVLRMEQEVGRDLQFIRINGSVLGAMVGGVLFAITHIGTLF